MITQIRDWLYVGNRDDCSQLSDAGCIHIWRDDHPDNSCEFHEHAEDFRWEYKDGHEIPVVELRKLSMIILSYFQDFGKVFIHCHAGQTRSPTICILALSLVEDRHPIDVLPDIYMPLWRKGLFPNICMSPLKDIVQWYERR